MNTSLNKNEDLTPQLALEILKKGNQRFVNNLSANYNLLQMVNETKDNQFPFAGILSCSDSRTSAELIFDQGLGDIFSVRLAGNIASFQAIASLEYAVKYLGTKLIVVLGHTKCGAIIGACNFVEIGNLDTIFKNIQPAIELETYTKEYRNGENPKFINNVAHLNVQHQIQFMLETSPLIKDLYQSKKVGIVGGLYDLGTGEVDFYDEGSMFILEEQYTHIKNNLMI
jgi:carbonic anhydrase